MLNPPRVWSIGLSALALLIAFSEPSRATEFVITHARDLHNGPISARVYVLLGPAKPKPGPKSDPRFGPDWFHTQPFFAVDARNWTPDTPLKLDAHALGYPTTLDKLEPGEYAAQAVVRLNPDTHKIGDGEGNAYGPIVTFSASSKPDSDPIKLSIDTIVPPQKFVETDRIKYVELDSPLLSAFHKRPMKHRAGVILPEGDKPHPGVLYIIPGFGGDHFMATAIVNDPRYSARFAFGADLVRVVLDPDCGTGHHVFADSARNGPHGKALIEELIPHIEKTFHVRSDPRTRLLNGHSSGGWSSLWLQTTYPDVFGGTWSTSPDSVDFHDFQDIDLYAPGANVFRDPDGKRRPIARQGDKVMLYFDKFSTLEDVIGDGGQIHSFEAVFSPVGPDGLSRPLYDRNSGAVNPDVIEAWKAYDIRLRLERNWATLAPKLKGKLHIVVGSLDNFYLDGPVAHLKTTLDTLGSDAFIEIVPGRDHSTILDAALAKRFAAEMSKTVNE